MHAGSLPGILLLLGTAVTVVLLFHRLRAPSSLGYLLAGIILSPHTIGPAVDAPGVQALAEFGIVFLLFTIGLNYSLPQLQALRGQIFLLGTGQVALTTLVVGLLAWLAGLPPAAAFVVGAVVAQSSTTIITRQLAEQGEEHSHHGRLGTAMSVFQDVTAVPFIVIIPVLGAMGGTGLPLAPLAWALAKALLALGLVLVLGRLLMRPLFHVVATRRSAELFTLTVLFISLLAAWTTGSLGLSMAFGAFLAGMVLGETEFRHQVEAAIRPFRDVLIGLFFVGIGMLFDPGNLAPVWYLAVLGGTGLLLVKALLVAVIVRHSGVDTRTALRTGLLLGVGGEFGLALLAIALEASVIDHRLAQILLGAVLFSMVCAPWVIRHNYALASRLAAQPSPAQDDTLPAPHAEQTGQMRDHVVICGFGRIGQNVAAFLDAEKIPYIALDLDAGRVREAHLAGKPVFFGDCTERPVLDAVGVAHARLVVISLDEIEPARAALRHVRAVSGEVPVMVRTRNEQHVAELQAAGATEVIPEMLEAGLVIASQALRLLAVPVARIAELSRSQRASRYRLLRELFPGDAYPNPPSDAAADRLHPVPVPAGGGAVGQAIGALALGAVAVTALVRDGERILSPAPDTALRADDVLVLFGRPDDLLRAERQLVQPS